MNGTQTLSWQNLSKMKLRRALFTDSLNLDLCKGLLELRVTSQRLLKAQLRSLQTLSSESLIGLL